MGATCNAVRALGGRRRRGPPHGFSEVLAALGLDAGRLTRYNTEVGVARAVFEAVAGLDPGAVRLAQTLITLIPGHRDHPAPRPGPDALPAPAVVTVANAPTETRATARAPRPAQPAGAARVGSPAGTLTA
jgi:hypothetical protein